MHLKLFLVFLLAIVIATSRITTGLVLGAVAGILGIILSPLILTLYWIAMISEEYKYHAVRFGLRKPDREYDPYDDRWHEVNDRPYYF